MKYFVVLVSIFFDVCAKNFDKIVVIEKGRIAEQGTHSTLMKRRGHYHALYSHQVKQNRVELEEYCALSG